MLSAAFRIPPFAKRRRMGHPRSRELEKKQKVGHAARRSARGDEQTELPNHGCNSISLCDWATARGDSHSHPLSIAALSVFRIAAFSSDEISSRSTRVCVARCHRGGTVLPEALGYIDFLHGDTLLCHSALSAILLLRQGGDLDPVRSLLRGAINYPVNSHG
jgi:hypothetical protein